MFGVMILKVKASKAYTLEELYERIKDVPFEAGEPRMCHYALAHAICFPEQDRNNQVQITVNKKGEISVSKSQAMGADNVAKNLALDRLTGGLSGMSMLHGKKKKRCDELTKKTAEQLNSLGL